VVDADTLVEGVIDEDVLIVAVAEGVAVRDLDGEPLLLLVIEAD